MKNKLVLSLILFLSLTCKGRAEVLKQLNFSGIAASSSLTVSTLTVTYTGTFGSGCIELGTLDSNARTQIWNKCSSAVLRLGSATSDGDASNVSSEGIVIYDPTNDQAARVKAARFGLTLNSDQTNGYYFKVDPTLMYYSSGPFTVGGRTAPSAGQIEARTSGTLAAVTAKSGATDFARIFVNTTPGLAWTSGDSFRIGGGSLDGGSFTEFARVDSAGKIGIGTSSPSSLLDVVGQGSTYILSVSSSQTSSSPAFGITNDGTTLKLRNVTILAANPLTGPGGNAFDGGSLNQSTTGNYQVVQYQLLPTTGLLPAWGPVTESVYRAIYGDSSNYSRLSLTAMADYANIGLSDYAHDFRLQEEAAGTENVRPIKVIAQYNDTGFVEEYMTFNTTYTITSTTNSVGDVLFFRRLDSPVPSGNHMRISIGQQVNTLSQALTSAGKQDSPLLDLYGDSFDTTFHNAHWIQQVNVTSNAGASTLKLKNYVDAASSSSVLDIADSGNVTFYNTATGFSPLTVGGTAVGSSIPIYISSGHLNFNIVGMGANAGDYYMARGGGATMAINTPTGSLMQFLNNNSLVMDVGATGVGIGKAPSVALDVVGSVTLGSAITDSVVFTGLPGLPSNAAPRTNITPQTSYKLIVNSTDNEVCISTGTTASTWAKITNMATACSH